MRLRLPLITLLSAAIVSCITTEQEPAAPVPQDLEPQVEAAPPLAAATAAPVEAAPIIHAGIKSAAAPNPTSPVQEGGLQETLQQAQRRAQQRSFLASEYVTQGTAELERADLNAALQSFSAALEIDPANQAARDGMRRVQALLGDEFQNAGQVLEDETQRLMVKRAQALLSVDEESRKGDQALAEGRYDDAVGHYSQAETILRWHPMIATESLDERIIAGKIEQARGLRSESAEREDMQQRQEAERLRQEAETEEAGRRENRLREYYELANTSFVNGDYANAERWTDLILVSDPGNEAASYLRETAREARHSQTTELNRKHYREQWTRTFEELNTMDVPQTEPLKFTLNRWREVRKRTPLEYGQLDPGAAADRAAVVAKLDQMSFAPDFGGPDGDGSPIAEVASYLQSLTGINFHVSPSVKDLDEEETSIRLTLPDRSVRKVLDIIADTTELRWQIQDGVVKFVTSEELTGGQILATYSVQDIINPIPDYPGREINVSPSGGITPPDEDIPEREANIVSITFLEELIRNNVDRDSWEADVANSIRITEVGQLVVNQTPEVHDKIKLLLEDLREATGIMVDIQTRFMKVEDNFLEDIGVDFRGLGQPGLGVDGRDFNDFGDPSTQNDLGQEIGQGSDLGAFFDEGEDGDIRARVEELYDVSLGSDQVLQASGGLSFQWTYLNDLQLELILRAVSKSERVEIVTAPRILVHNTARANLAVLNQVAYVQDFDVEIAQAASIADPIVGVIEDGVVLDVRPVVSADRRFITMELRPTIAELQRPIREQITTLGSQNSVTIQLPEVEFQRVRTSIPIPDGSTVLLGGMKVSEKQNQRSAVPLLSKIPIISALFERQGKFVSNRKLLILLRANIVIPEEAEPTGPELGEND